MSHDSTLATTLLARGLAVAASLTRLEKMNEMADKAGVKLDYSLRIEFKTYEAQLTAIADQLSRETFRASGYELIQALRHGCRPTRETSMVYDKLLATLSLSDGEDDQSMARLLQTFCG